MPEGKLSTKPHVRRQSIQETVFIGYMLVSDELFFSIFHIDTFRFLGDTSLRQAAQARIVQTEAILTRKGK